MAERRASARAHALRREVVARRRWLQTAWWVGIAAAGVGVYLALEGVGLAASVCFVLSATLLWLSGTWVLPRSRDSYLANLSDVWTDWASQVQQAAAVSSRRRAEGVGRLQVLPCPPEFGDEHQRLMTLLGETGSVNSDSSVPFAERASRATGTLHALAEVKDRLAARASTDAQRHYAAALESLLDERLAHYATATRNAEDATEEAVRILSRMRVPAESTTAHAAVIEAFTAYLASAREFHEACQSLQASRAATAAAQLESTQARLLTVVTRIDARLDYATRGSA
jgi:hypothetical protein